MCKNGLCTPVDSSLFETLWIVIRNAGSLSITSPSFCASFCPIVHMSTTIHTDCVEKGTWVFPEVQGW